MKRKTLLEGNITVEKQLNRDISVIASYGH